MKEAAEVLVAAQQRVDAADWSGAETLVRQHASAVVGNLTPELSALYVRVQYYRGAFDIGRAWLALHLGRHGRKFVRELRSARAPRSEAYRTPHRLLLKELERLVDIVVAQPVSNSMLLEAARLKSHNRSADRRDFWQRLIDAGTGPSGYAEYHLARDLARDGDWQDAAPLAEATKGTAYEAKGSALLVNLQARLSSRAAVESYVAAVLNLDSRAAVSVVRKHAAPHGISDPSAVDSLTRALTDALGERSLPDVGPRTRSRRADENLGKGFVFLCGFEFSGTGALRDLLRDQEGIRLVLGDRYRGTPSLRGMSLASSKGLDAIRSELAGYVAEQLLGLGGGNPAYCLASFYGEDAPTWQTLHQAALSLLREVDLSSPDDCRRFEQSFGRFLTTALRGDSETDSQILTVNFIKDGFVDHLRFLPGCRTVLVIRDPRDQYVDQYINRQTDGPMAFIAESKEKYSRIHEVTDGPHSDSVLLVRFEEFVHRAAVRNEVLHFIGPPGRSFPGQSYNQDRYFDARASLRNIGIHREFPDQKSMQRIAEELPNFVWGEEG